MHRLAKPVRIIGVLCIAVALGACSAIKLAYDSVPRVGTWWLDGYVDLSHAQELRVRDAFAQLQQWHRHEELPKVAALLQQAEQLASREATPQDICALVPEIRERLIALGSRAEPAAVTLALGLSPGQLLALEGKYRKDNAQYRREWVDVSPDKLRQKRMKQSIEWLESFYGPLVEGQREIIRAQVEHSVFDPAKNLSERQRRQQDILQTMRLLTGQAVAPQDAPSSVRALVERGLQSPDPAQRAYQEASIQEGCVNLSALHRSTTPQQRQSAVQRLRAYQQDVSELVAEP
ncbi:MAG: hypothetical protein NVS3B2_05470 [Ramlibacter sp.]